VGSGFVNAVAHRGRPSTARLRASLDQAVAEV